MPTSSWFHMLRRRRKGGKRSTACRAQGAAADDAEAVAASSACAGEQKSQCQPPAAPSQQPPAACAGYSPNRASYYFPSADRARQDGGLRCIAPRGDDGDEGTALNVRVDVVHSRAGRLGGIDAPPATPELKLRPIVTRPAAKNEPPDNVGGSGSATTSAATTPSTRARGFHMKPSGRRRRHGHDNSSPLKDKEAAAVSLHGGTTRRRWLYESLVVVKTSSDPEREMAESMAEMVVANHIRSSEDLEELLACYLALNAAEHHRAVVAAFRRVWLHLARQRLHLHG